MNENPRFQGRLNFLVFFRISICLAAALSYQGLSSSLRPAEFGPKFAFSEN